MPRLEREARSPTGQIFLIFFPVIGGERGRACTTTTLLVRPRESLPPRFRLLLIRCDNVLSISLSIFLSVVVLE